MTTLIVISGEIGSGKSTVSKIITAKLAAAKVIPMAESLKAMAVELGWNGKKDDRGRRFLQALGQGMRELDSDYWLKLWTPKYLSHLYKMADHNPLVVIDDIRYDNEFDLADHFEGIHIRMTGFSNPNIAKGDPNHPSERDWRSRNYDYEITNEGTIDDLVDHTTMLLEDLDLE